MSTEYQLETLIVKLTGEGSSYRKMLDEANQQTQKVTQEIAAQTQKVQQFTNSIHAYAKSLLGVFGSLGISTSLMGAFHAFERADTGAKKLSAAIAANGGNVATTTKRYLEFAAGIAKVTTSSKGATLGLLQQAESMGITGAAAERAVKNAIALGAARGGDAEGYLRMTIALEQGHVEMLQRMLPQLKDAKTHTEKLAMAQKLLASMYGVAEVDGGTVSAQLGRITKTFEGMSKEVGAVVAVGLKPLVGWLEKASQSFKAVPTWVTATLVVIISLTAAIVGAAHAWPLLVGAIMSTKAALVGFGSSVLLNPATAWIAGIGLLVAGLVALKYALDESNPAIISHTAAMAEAARQQTVVGQRITAETTHISSRASGIADPVTRAKYLGDELKKAQAEADKFAGQIGAVEDHVAELKKTPWIMQRPKDRRELEATLQNLENLKDSGTKAAEKIAAVQSALDALKPGPGIKELEEHLKRQVDTFGMSETEVKLYDLRLAGATEGQLANAQALAGQVEALQAAKEETKKVNEAVARAEEQRHSFIEGLQAEIETYGMGTEAAKLYRLEKEGGEWADKELAHTLVMQKQALDGTKKIMEDAARVTKEYQSPQDTFNEKVAELNELLESGYLAADVYARAIQKLTDDLNKAGKAHRDLNSAANTPEWGSSAHLRMLQDYREFIKSNIVNGLNGARPQANGGAGNPRPVPVEINQPGADPVRDAVVKQLVLLNTTAAQIRDKPWGGFQPADLGG